MPHPAGLIQCGQITSCAFCNFGVSIAKSSQHALHSPHVRRGTRSSGTFNALASIKTLTLLPIHPFYSYLMAKPSLAVSLHDGRSVKERRWGAATFPAGFISRPDVRS